MRRHEWFVLLQRNDEWLAVVQTCRTSASDEYETLSEKNSMTGKNPKRTLQSRFESQLFHLADGEDIKLTLKDILDIAMDLDKRYEDQTALPSSNVAALYGTGTTRRKRR